MGTMINSNVLDMNYYIPINKYFFSASMGAGIETNNLAIENSDK